MAEKNEYTLKELLEEARKDASWEPDDEKRNMLVDVLLMYLDRM